MKGIFLNAAFVLKSNSFSLFFLLLFGSYYLFVPLTNLPQLKIKLVRLPLKPIFKVYIYFKGTSSKYSDPDLTLLYFYSGTSLKYLHRLKNNLHLNLNTVQNILVSFSWASILLCLVNFDNNLLF